MELMAQYPDKYFDLAIVDPPYGIGEGGKRNASRVGKWKANEYEDYGDNMNSKPNKQYFDELFRVSKNQIIWGANYFSEFLPPKMGWIYWRKNTFNDFSKGELAYTSFDRALNEYEYTWSGFRQGKSNQSIQKRIHPNEKPITLYEWILMNYAKQGDLILDTHLGSGSIALACYNLSFDLVGCELHKGYFAKAKKRFDLHSSQLLITL